MRRGKGRGSWAAPGRRSRTSSLGRQGPDLNGAGIRLEGAGLTVRGATSTTTRNGILGGRPGPGSDVVIEYSEFARNGAGDGFSHNLYIGRARSFTLRYSYVHHARVGHLVKEPRPGELHPVQRLTDEATGNSSRAIDLSVGGLSFVIGNVFHKGPKAENPDAIRVRAGGSDERGGRSSTSSTTRS